MSDPDTSRFVICIRNEGYVASLELRKVYRELPAPGPREEDLIRVVDESGEDYLYPKSLFLPVELSAEARKAIARVS